METQQITVDRVEARRLYLKYRAHQHYSTPIDQEIQRVYRAIAKGRVVIRALDSISSAGLGPDGLPKLAIARADAEAVWLRLEHNGSARFAIKQWTREVETRCYIDMPAGSFSGAKFKSARAIAPLIPIEHRPQRGLANYHLLLEADWKEIPVDPMLLRRIGQADLWVVCAAWDLTPVERAVLAGRRG
jgi:hypothetical protein